jgi:hypothetical protein
LTSKKAVLYQTEFASSCCALVRDARSRGHAEELSICFRDLSGKRRLESDPCSDHEAGDHATHANVLQQTVTVYHSNAGSIIDYTPIHDDLRSVVPPFGVQLFPRL